MPRGGVRKIYILKVEEVDRNTVKLIIRSFLKDEAEFRMLCEGAERLLGDDGSVIGDWSSKSLTTSLRTIDLETLKQRLRAQGARLE